MTTHYTTDGLGGMNASVWWGLTVCPHSAICARVLQTIGGSVVSSVLILTIKAPMLSVVGAGASFKPDMLVFRSRRAAIFLPLLQSPCAFLRKTLCDSAQRDTA